MRGDLQDTSARPRFDAALAVARGQPGEYSVTFANQRRAEAPVRYDVALTYGGALRRQQFITRRRHDGGTWSLFVLPMQLNHDGDAAATTSGRIRRASTRRPPTGSTPPATRAATISSSPTSSARRCTATSRSS